MKFVSLNEFARMMDPAARRAAEDRYMSQCVAQAKLEQAERHHYERMAVEREKIDAHAQSAKVQAEAAYSMEALKHSNELGMANRNHLLGVAGRSSALIDDMAASVMRQDEEWNKVMADTFRTLVTKEADLITQERLRKLDQEHLVQKLRLEGNLKLVELVVSHELQNAKLAFEKACEIIFRLVERALDLKEEAAEADSVRMWVREAMGQTGIG